MGSSLQGTLYYRCGKQAFRCVLAGSLALALGGILLAAQAADNDPPKTVADSSMQAKSSRLIISLLCDVSESGGRRGNDAARAGKRQRYTSNNISARQPAGGDIPNCCDVLQLATRVPGRLSHCVHVLDRLVRH